MASTILADNGVSTGSAGLKTAADSTGVLALQTTTAGGVATTALSISNTQVVTYTNQPVYSGGTANGVMYLNGSKVVTTGTALTFDGTNLGVGTTSPGFSLDVQKATVGTVASFRGSNASRSLYITSSTTTNNGDTYTLDATSSTGVLAFALTSSEQMRLTSTGLGIGTSSPGQKLELASSGDVTLRLRSSAGTNDAVADITGYSNALQTGGITFSTRNAGTLAERMRLDSSGNLGLGVTPSTWSQGKALEISAVGEGLWGNGAGDVWMINNCYYNSGWKFASGSGTAKATAYRQGAGATAGTHTWSIAGSGTAGGAITFTDAMTLDASGNLALGRTTASVLLDMETSGGAAAYWRRTGFSNRGTINVDGTNMTVASEGALILGAGTSFAERARIDSSGNLLVGTTSASETSGVGFKMNYNAIGPSFTVVGSASTTAYDTLHVYSTGAGAYRFYVDYSGLVHATSTTISAISDIRFKENVRDLNVGLAEVMALKPRLYDWKEGKGANIKNARGFIAQEFEQVFPDLIDEWKDPAPEGEEPYKSVRQDLIPVLVKAIQEQQALIQTLTERITVLESK